MPLTLRRPVAVAALMRGGVPSPSSLFRCHSSALEGVCALAFRSSALGVGPSAATLSSSLGRAALLVLLLRHVARLRR